MGDEVIVRMRLPRYVNPEKVSFTVLSINNELKVLNIGTAQGIGFFLIQEWLDVMRLLSFPL